MQARAWVDFRLTCAEFWGLTVEEWNAYCFVGDRTAMMLDKQLAEVKRVVIAPYLQQGASLPSAEEFRILKDFDHDPDPGIDYDAEGDLAYETIMRNIF